MFTDGVFLVEGQEMSRMDQMDRFNLLTHTWTMWAPPPSFSVPPHLLTWVLVQLDINWLHFSICPLWRLNWNKTTS